MRRDEWERSAFFTARYEAKSWACRSVGAARGLVAPLPEREAREMRELAADLRKCAAELEEASHRGGNTTDEITAMAAGE